MNKKVLIKLENEQDFVENNNSEQISLEFDGEFYEKREKFYLSYNDHSEGLEGAQTILKIDPQAERVLLMRKEPAEMKQDFKIGEKIKGYLNTQYGEIKTSVKTKRLEIDIKEKKGRIKIKYELYLGGELSSNHYLELSYDIVEE